LYEGAKGQSPRKGKDELPLYIKTTLRPIPVETAASSSSSPRHSQQHLADLVKARDRNRCVITGASNTMKACHACHILAKDERSRRIPTEFFEKIKQKLSAAEYKTVQPWLTPSDTNCLVNFRNVGPYEPRIALYCRDGYDWIEDGKVWFQPSADGDGALRFRRAGCQIREETLQIRWCSHRRPDAPPEGEAARSKVDAQAWLESWPPRRVFDLHRLVLAPYRRSKDRKEKNVTRKRKTPPASTPPL